MAQIFTKEALSEVIGEMMKKELDQVFDEEFEKAANRVKERRAEIISRAAVTLSRRFHIATNDTNVIITVEDEQR